MAIFTESTCLNWFNESNKSGLTFIDNKCKINDKKNCLNDDKLVKCLNSSWPKIKKMIYSKINEYIDDWYKNDDGSYEYDANTIDKVMKFGTLDLVDIEKFSNGTFNISFWYNNSAKSNKNSNKFFGGHVVIAGVNITSNYKISNNLEFSIEG